MRAGARAWESARSVGDQRYRRLQRRSPPLQLPTRSPLPTWSYGQRKWLYGRARCAIEATYIRTRWEAYQPCSNGADINGRCKRTKARMGGSKLLSREGERLGQASGCCRRFVRYEAERLTCLRRRCRLNLVAVSPVSRTRTRTTSHAVHKCRKAINAITERCGC
jgi:hypothetical protein